MLNGGMSVLVGPLTTSWAKEHHRRERRRLKRAEGWRLLYTMAWHLSSEYRVGLVSGFFDFSPVAYFLFIVYFRGLICVVAVCLFLFFAVVWLTRMWKVKWQTLRCLFIPEFSFSRVFFSAPTIYFFHRLSSSTGKLFTCSVVLSLRSSLSTYLSISIHLYIFVYL